MRLLFGHDRELARWAAARIPHMGADADFGPCAALGVVGEDGRLLGAVVFSSYYPRYRSIEISFAAASPRWLTLRLVRQILAYPFTQLDCIRVTAVTPKRERRARRFIEDFGFKREGLVRKGFGGDDAVVYGLLKAEWLRSRWNQHGQIRPDPSGPARPDRGRGLADERQREHRAPAGHAQQHELLGSAGGRLLHPVSGQ
jgi:RimJ/RimL family protein N-acetyltransferase